MPRDGRPLIRVDGVSGATDLGDGRVVLILDPPALRAGARAPDRAGAGARQRGATRRGGRS